MKNRARSAAERETPFSRPAGRSIGLAMNDAGEPLSKPLSVSVPETRCAHCNGLIVYRKIYRCMDCRLPHHRRCLFIHCGRDSQEKGGEAYLDALKGIA